MLVVRLRFKSAPTMLFCYWLDRSDSLSVFSQDWCWKKQTNDTKI